MWPFHTDQIPTSDRGTTDRFRRAAERRRTFRRDPATDPPTRHA